MTTEENSIKLMKFRQPGKSDRECYQPWLNSLYDLAGSKTRTVFDYGLLGYVMPEAEYTTLAGAAFVPIQHPGNVPAADRQTAYKLNLNRTICNK